MDNQNETFYCPYCGCTRDKKFLHYRTETGNYHQTFEKSKGLRAAYDYKHINYKYQIYRLPICTDCKRIRRNAGIKAMLIVLILFAIIFYLLQKTISENGTLGDIALPLGVVSLILLAIKWGLTVLFIKMKDIHYSAHKEYEYFLNGPDSYFDMERRFEEFEKERDEVFSSRKIILFDKYNRPIYNQKTDTESDDNRPIPHDYSDEDFEGHFV